MLYIKLPLVALMLLNMYKQGYDRRTDRLIALTIPLLHDRRFDRLEDGRMNERTDFDNNTD